MWIHSDLMRGNILAHRGRLGAVIDFGLLRAADPAGSAGRSIEVISIPYYRDRFPGRGRRSLDLIETVLRDADRG